MLFNTPEYLFIFLPICVIAFYAIAKSPWSKQNTILLLLASLIFYTVWSPLHLILLIGSITGNFFISQNLSSTYNADKCKNSSRKFFLTVGILINLIPLVVFKYSYFIVENGNYLFGTQYSIARLTLPLAISFFSFQQISYLVDCYKGLKPSESFINYALYVSFFPQLIAGPIVRYQELTPQLLSLKENTFSPTKFGSGTTLIAIGLFKKVVLADQIGSTVDIGYSIANSLNFLESWLISIGFTLQIYYDFSGYTDIAIGTALLFGIILPQNFNSPYKSQNIREFWKRWHITLSNWFLDYVYKPLGGNRKTDTLVAFNILATFFLSGLWHGAGWNFVAWGLAHGIALVCFKTFSQFNIKIPKSISLIATFAFINTTWIIFRSPDLTTALNVIASLMDFEQLALSSNFSELLTQAGEHSLFSSIPLPPTASIVPYELLIFIGLAIIPFKNSNSIALTKIKSPYTHLRSTIISILAGLSIALILSSKGSNFIYFNF